MLEGRWPYRRGVATVGSGGQPRFAPSWLRHLAEIGSVPTDSEELRLRKAVLTLSAAMMASLAFVWIATYAALGLWVSAAIPLAYQVATVLSIATFARTRRYRLFRTSQLWMSLLLPFLLQWSLGGFQNASAVCLWGFTAPVGALLFVGARPAVPWFLGFAGLVGLSGAIDPLLNPGASHVPHALVVTFFVLNLIGVTTTAYVLLQYFVRAREGALAELAREHHALEVEQAKSESLLLNVLPEPVARRLKDRDEIIADASPGVTVLFADLVGFTQLTDRLAAPDLVALLDRVFARWDALATRYGVEKIKTIGDAYMVAGGLPVPRVDHAEAIAEMALDMGPEVQRCAAEAGLSLQVRIGIDTGPVVAGVIGRAKFIYDLWGDTVNTASRMESHAAPGSIQVTERTYELLRRRFELHRRGATDVKGKGPMTTYLLLGRHCQEHEEGARRAPQELAD